VRSAVIRGSAAVETLFGNARQHGTTIRQVKLRGRNKAGDGFTIAMLVLEQAV
jgi:hypothetical protein